MVLELKNRCRGIEPQSSLAGDILCRPAAATANTLRRTNDNFVPVDFVLYMSLQKPCQTHHKDEKFCIFLYFSCLVPRGGLEPPPLTGPDSKSGASTNSAIWAIKFLICRVRGIRTPDLMLPMHES